MYQSSTLAASKREESKIKKGISRNSERIRFINDYNIVIGKYLKLRRGRREKILLIQSNC